MRYICTYFDINFLPRGLALIDSLEKNAGKYKLYILALDNQVVEFFKKLNNNNIEVIELHEYIEFFNIDRSKYTNKKEFYFSLTPGLCIYALKKHDKIDILLYLDADVYLFNDIEILYSEIGDASIAMCSHRIPWYINVLSKNYGIYNVGVNAFRNDSEGLRCLEQWHKECTTWTPDLEGYPLSFFSDQIWLDKWPKLYKNIKVISHKGINTAPWNAIQYSFKIHNGVYYVDEVPLVIYHFSSLKQLDDYTWHGNTSFTILDIKGVLERIYKMYIENIQKYITNKNTATIELEFSGSSVKIAIYSLLRLIHNHKIIFEQKSRRDKH